MTTTTSTKPAVLEDETPEIAITDKQIINEAIGRVVDATGIDVQKNRYKAMRAIAFQAFANSIAAGTFDDLVNEAIANIGSLPSGWEIEPPAKVEIAKAAVKVKATPAKPAAR